MVDSPPKLAIEHSKTTSPPNVIRLPTSNSIKYEKAYKPLLLEKLLNPPKG